MLMIWKLQSTTKEKTQGWKLGIDKYDKLSSCLVPWPKEVSSYLSLEPLVSSLPRTECCQSKTSDFQDPGKTAPITIPN